MCAYCKEETVVEEEEEGEKRAVAARKPPSGLLDFWSKLYSSEALAAGQLPADFSDAAAQIDAIGGSNQEDITRFGAHGYLPMKVRSLVEFLRASVCCLLLLCTFSYAYE